MHHTLDKTAIEVVVRPNTYATILVHVEPHLASSHRVEVAARLARDLGATLIGLGAETFAPAPAMDPFMGYAAGEWIALGQTQITNDLAAAETAFRRDAAGADLEWRAVRDYPHEAVTSLAHAVDLVVVSPRSVLGESWAADPADVVMDAGRPVLMVPEGRHHLIGMAVVVAWKDSREARRALTDALPFLQRADDVIVHAVCKPDETVAAEQQTAEVVANLKRHGVCARALVTNAEPYGVAAELERVAAMNEADLIVAGAYGHSRLREWAFGGVTNAFMHHPNCFVLFSH
jgi:nucleotide-binding universal stress UspA family protein